MVESGANPLQQIFKSFCGKESTMDGKSFAKFAKDTKLIDKKFSTTDVDLLFAKVKSGSERRITFEQFKNALQQIAAKKGVDVEAMKAALLAAGGPQFAGTQADNVRFHDDKSQYTGVYAQGGPTNVDSINPAASFGQAPGGAAPNEEQKVAPKPKAAAVVASGAPAGSLNEVFKHFSGGANDMDGKTFAKLAKDTKILDKNLTTTDIDLIFAKVKDKAARKITFDQFKAAVALCAAKKKIGEGDLEAKLLAAGGPVFSGTKAENVKYHDDKSLYTGVYAAGGPSTVDAGNGMISDISQLCDRSDADVRGSKK